jgi:hypothetical protein
MLPDLRFAFGATLAIAMLAVAGFGLAISTQLLHEARVSSLESTPSLAYAGQAENNPFYDPQSALRFTKALGKPDEPTAQAQPAKPPEPIPAPPAVPDEPAAVPADRTETSTAGNKAAEPAPAPAAETSPAPTPAPLQETKPPEAAETSAPLDRPKPPEATERSAPSDTSKPPEASGQAAGNSRPADPESEPVANAQAASPAADMRKAEDAQPSAGNPAASAPPPAPAASAPPPAPTVKPVRHRPRPKVARTARPAPQGFQYAGFPTSTTQWPSYGPQWGSPPAAKRKNGTVAGRQ